MVNLFIANTDNSWFDFLSSQPSLPDVNFWWPHEMAFRALQPGELLVFRLKRPRNKIGGFGIFTNYSPLPLQMAWETFGRSNGSPTPEAFRNAIAELRGDAAVGPMTNIGCTILAEPVFLPPARWFDLPLSWSRSIQRGKLYSTGNSEGLDLWDRLQDAARMVSHAIGPGLSDVVHARYGTPQLITPRLGQGAFRIAVTEAYGRQCAVSDGKVLPALDAAHIQPYGEGGLHIKSNGILLRKDIHSVFDAGYVTVNQDYRFSVSNKVKEVFNNGEEYLKLHGKSLRLPNHKSDWPDPEFLKWHHINRYLG
jgi:putative restriction endonuclease